MICISARSPALTKKDIQIQVAPKPSLQTICQFLHRKNISRLFEFCVSLSFFHRQVFFSCGRAVSSINTSSFPRIIHELTLGPRYRGRASISDKPSRFTTTWKNSSDFDDHLNTYGQWWWWLRCWRYKAVVPSWRNLTGSNQLGKWRRKDLKVDLLFHMKSCEILPVAMFYC